MIRRQLAAVVPAFGFAPGMKVAVRTSIDAGTSAGGVALAAMFLLQACQSSPPMAEMPEPTFTIASRVLGETRRINVYVPPGYAQDRSARYPVLYMPDGGLEEDFPHITAAMDAGIREGAVRPFVVVGIENTERRRDMTGPTEVAKDRTIAPHVGGSAAFRAFLRDELMAEIRTRVRTTDETAIVGESLAGLFVIETMLLEPGLFDTCVAVSPSLWWNDHEFVRTAASRVGAAGLRGRRLWLTAGEDDFEYSRIDEFAAALRSSAAPGFRWQYVPRPDLKHSTIFHAIAPVAFRAVFAPANGRP
jgi:predicted alpha/beta superfamily hydrolase